MEIKWHVCNEQMKEIPLFQPSYLPFTLPVFANRPLQQYLDPKRPRMYYIMLQRCVFWCSRGLSFVEATYAMKNSWSRFSSKTATSLVPHSRAWHFHCSFYANNLETNFALQLKRKVRNSAVEAMSFRNSFKDSDWCQTNSTQRLQMQRWDHAHAGGIWQVAIFPVKTWSFKKMHTKLTLQSWVFSWNLLSGCK